VGLRIFFAVLSFVAFDLVIGAVVMRGWSWSGVAALLTAAIVSAGIALDVAKVWPDPALHAAPVVARAVFGLHLMACRRTSPLTVAHDQTSPPQTEVNVTVNTALAHVNMPPSISSTLTADVGGDESIVNLKDVHGLSFTQIGERLGISRQAAWQQYKAAKKENDL
jgi:hypothetical protein